MKAWNVSWMYEDRKLNNDFKDRTLAIEFVEDLLKEGVTNVNIKFRTNC